MHVPFETMAPGAITRNARGPRPPREHPEPFEAAAMLAAAHRIVATSRIAFAADDPPAHASAAVS